MQSVKPYVSLHTLKMIYYSYFHSLVTYGLLLWRHSSDSIKIFRLQKKIIRIMMGCGISDSCRKLFFNLEILLLLPRTSFLFFCLWLKNRNQFMVISEMYHIATRQHANIHQPSTKWTKYQKWVYCLGVKVFNVLPSYIKIESDNPKQFKLILQKFFYENS